MTDMSAQPPIGSGGRHPKADASMASDRQVAFWAIDLMLDPHIRYRRHLEMCIAPNPVLHIGNRKLLKCHLARLAEPYALGILAVVWSLCLRKRKGLVNMVRKRNGNTLIVTRHALGKALEKSSGQQPGGDGWPKYLRRASRVVEAAITYGLIAEEKSPPGCLSGCKPLRGTKRLDEFMVALGLDFGVRVRKSFLYSGKKLCVPPHVKKRKGASKR